MPTNLSKKLPLSPIKSPYRWKWVDFTTKEEIIVFYEGEEIGRATEYFKALNIENKHRELIKLLEK